MKAQSVYLLLLVASTIVVAAQRNRDHDRDHDRPHHDDEWVVFEREDVPPGWVSLGQADRHQTLEFSMVLKQQNIDVLERALEDISDPNSANFGKHWTKDKILAVIAPPKDDVDAVVEWLHHSRATVIDVLGDVIKARAEVRRCEHMFNTEFYNFEHTSGRRVTSQMGKYTLPRNLKGIVDFVAGISEFPVSRSTKRQMAKALGEQSSEQLGYVFPQLLQQAYGIPASFRMNPKSSVCVVEFQDDSSFSKSDLATFEQEMAVPHINVSHIVGPYSPSIPDAESSLDIQYAGAIAQNATMWFWTVQGWMYDFVIELFNTNEVPYVVSMSWGWPEPWQCQVGKCNSSTSIEYVDRVNIEFLKITLRGVTLLAASGDQGAPGDMNPYCSNTDTPLSAIFPGASPYVTSVGATMLVPTNSTLPTMDQPPICSKYDCASTTAEGVCTYPTALITSGGGFSFVSARPKWQQKFVSAYLQNAPQPPKKYFNSTNRGFPDVAALGHNYLIDWDGNWLQVDGTSCSSPVFAAMVGMLNSWRLGQGKSSLGFINRLLYDAYANNPSTFHDMIGGNNKCTEGCCQSLGYEVVKGWDAATGLGSPNFPALLAYIKTLP